MPHGVRERREGAARVDTRRRQPTCPRGPGRGVRTRSTASRRARRTSPRSARSPDRSAGAARARARGSRWRGRGARSPGQGASGLTWSIVTGDTPPQSLMPASRRRGNPSYEQIGRRLDVHVRAEQRTGGRDGPGMLLERRLRMRRASSCRAWRGSSGRSPPGLAVALVHSRIASSASMRSARVSPMPIRIPVVNGTRARPRPRRVSSRTAGALSGDPKCGPPRSRQPVRRRLEHDSLRGRDLAQQGAPPPTYAGIDMGEEPGLLEHQLGHTARDTRLSSRTRAPRARRAPRGSGAPACHRG